MEKIPLTRVYLESLINSDLIKMANDFGLDVSENSDRVFIIEELLDTASNDEDTQDIKNADDVLVEAVPLPKIYNITFLEVMIRDPLWAFVFWEIKASEAEQFEKACDFNGYYLKVSPLDNHRDSTHKEKVFTVPVKAEDTAWYLSLSPMDGASLTDKTPFQDQSRYKVEFCASMGGVETVLAVSAPIKLPGQTAFSSVACENQLVKLSGCDNFHILRRNERSPRAKVSEKNNE